MKTIISAISGAILAGALLTSGANATTLSGSLTTDDTFAVYLSTDDSVLGTLVVADSDNFWPTVTSFSGAALTPGVTNYLHIVGQDIYGLISAVIGQFTLSDANFEFANGTQSLVTDTTHWKADQATGPWSAPSGTPASYGLNGVGPWGFIGSISPTAQWIWWGNQSQLGSVYLSTAITPVVADTPLPAAWTLLLGGLAVVGYLGRRRSRISNSA